MTTAYEYDSRHRLTKACFAASSCTGASDWVSYAYDAVSDRLSEGRPAGTTTYTFNAADQFTAPSGLNGAKTFSYDARGNQVGAGSDTFAYNLADRMTSATVAGTTTWSDPGSADTLTLGMRMLLRPRSLPARVRPIDENSVRAKGIRLASEPAVGRDTACPEGTALARDGGVRT